MTICPLQSTDDRALAFGHAHPAVIFKHSPRCFTSFRALDEVNAFSRAHPDAQVLVVDVIGQRDLSAVLADQLGVRHESPQVIITRHGRASWSGAHSTITDEQLTAAYIRSQMQVTEPAIVAHGPATPPTAVEPGDYDDSAGRIALLGVALTATVLMAGLLLIGG